MQKRTKAMAGGERGRVRPMCHKQGGAAEWPRKAACRCLQGPPLPQQTPDALLATGTLRRLLATGLCICFLAAHRGKNICFSDGILIVVAPPIAEPSIVKVTVAHIVRRTYICSSDVDSVGQAVLFGVALLCALPHGAPWLPSVFFRLEQLGALVREVEAPVRPPERLLLTIALVLGVRVVMLLLALPLGRGGA